MREISDKTLTILLIAAITISLGGTFMSLSRLAQIRGLPITGFVTSNTSTGYVNLSVVGGVSFRITNNVEFGAGFVNGSCCAELAGNVTNVVNGTGTWNWGSIQYFLLENDGNRDLQINISSDKNATNLTGGTNPGFAFAMVFEESNACNGTAATAWTEILVNGTLPPGATSIQSNQSICTSLRYETANDQLNITFRITVPENAITGTKSANITFIARQPNE